MTSRIPLRNRRGDIVAEALVDDEDLDRVLAEGRWCRNGSGYVVRRDGKRILYLHRFLLGLEYGDPRQGDHENRDRLDHRRSNLRIVDGSAENAQNVPARDGTSRYRGVHRFRTGRWVAQCKVQGRTRHIGYFDTEDEANDAAIAFRREHLPMAVD